MAKKYQQLSKILKKLLFDKEMKCVDLAREVNIPQPTIHRLVSGKSTRPYKSSLQPIADYFSITVDQLIGEEAIATSNDVIHDKKTEKTIILKKIPLIQWKAISNFLAAENVTSQDLAVTYKISDQAFALIMSDSSMEPLFPKGSILIFDPEIEPQDRNFILVKSQASGSYFFRQLLIDMGYKYVKSLNPDLSTSKLHLLNQEDKIIACLVESRNNYLNTSRGELIEELL